MSTDSKGGESLAQSYIDKNGVPCLNKKPKVGPAGYQGRIALCPVCGVTDYTTRHHLKPRESAHNNVCNQGNILRLCVACHHFLHKTFPNEHLESSLYTLELIRANCEVQAYIKTRRETETCQRKKA